MKNEWARSLGVLSYLIFFESVEANIDIYKLREKNLKINHKGHKISLILKYKL